MEKIRIGFDLDGVLCDFYEAVRLRILEKTKYDMGNEIRTYKLTCPKLTDKQMSKIIKETIYDYESIQPYPNIKKILSSFVLMTNEPIHIITSRFKSTKSVTTAWLDKNLRLNKDTAKLEEDIVIPYDVHFVPSSDKRYFLDFNDFTFFVEDRLRTANQCFSQDIVFLINRPWNMGREVNRKVIRVDSLDEVLDDYTLLSKLKVKYL